MKLKSSRLLMPFFIILMFVMMWGVSSFKVEAASTDLYFPNTILGQDNENVTDHGYDTNGVAYLKEQLVIYAHNNGVGYNMGSKVTVSKVTVQVGNSTDGFREYDGDNTDYVNVSSSGVALDNCSGDYGCWASDADNKESKYVGTITVNIAKIIADIRNNSDLDFENTVTVTLYLKRKTTWIESIGGNEWKDFDYPVNGYKGSTFTNSATGSASATFNITDSTFASKYFGISAFVLSGSSTDMSKIVSTYNGLDHKNKKEAYLIMQSNYPFKGNVKACYSTTCSTLVFDGSNQANVATYSTILKSLKAEKNIEIKSESFSGAATDLYGSSISQLKFNSGISNTVSFYLDNVAPTVLSAGVNDKLGSVHYDITEIYTDINLSEDVSYTGLKLKFDIGGVESEVILDDEINNGNSEGKKITKTILLSGNGVISLKSFYIVVTDSVGNSSTYTYNNTSSLCTANDVVTLNSSIKGASIDKSHYYSGETVNIEVELESSSVDLNDFETITLRDADSNTVHTFSGWTTENNIAKFTYTVGPTAISVTNIVFTKLVGTISTEVANPVLNLVLNEYLNLELENMNNPTDKKFDLYDNSEKELGKVQTFDSNLINVSGVSLSNLACSLNDEKDNISCEYASSVDGQDRITIADGAIVLDNGMKNNEQSFYLVVNERNPVVSYTITNTFEYEGKSYYRYGNGILTLTLTDGFGTNSCIYYSVNDGDFIENCTEGTESNLVFSFPHENKEYKFTYYTSDGENEGDEITLEETFVYRGAFNEGDITLSINDKGLEEVSLDDEYNYVSVKYNNAQKLDLLKEIKVHVYANGGVSKSCFLAECTIAFNTIELGNVDDNTEIKIELIDQLDNAESYVLTLNLDTILPTFDLVNATVQKVDTNYTVTLSDYQPYSVEVKVDGVTTTLNNDKFTTTKEMFTLYLTDKAGNINSKVFTTVSPYIELFPLTVGTTNVSYEINISPFNSSIHQIEDYRYLVFDYNSVVSNEDMNIAKANVCTTGRKTNCYLEGNYTSNSPLINQTFARGYSYILLVKVNNVLVNLKDSNNLPRIDIVGSDVIDPVGGFLDEDINPDYISSTSGNQFKFSFLATDVNLKDTYYYLVTKSTLTMNVDKFYDLYTNCYGAVASNNSCGIKGSGSYISETTPNIHLGEIVIEANNNTRKRLENNTMYSLYVLLLDDGNNETVFKVRNFTNISNASVVEYKNDSGEFVQITEGEVSTNSTSEIKVSKYGDINIASVKVNGTDISCNASGCNYVLIAGKHDVEVTDALGNVRNVTIYSAISSKPFIQLEYLYDSVYYKLSDSAYAYNSSNANNIYVKVSGNNLDSITLVMGVSKVYQTGSEVFDELTSATNVHGITLLELINLHLSSSDYDGTITISVTNTDGGSSSVSMLVDNTAPEITLALPGTSINLLGDQYTLTSSSGKYGLEYNYKSDITYAYLLEALLVKVDGNDILSMSGVERLKIRVDGSLLEDLYTSVTKGNKVMTIDYFDNAGNVATQVTINLNVIDNEKPVIILRNKLDSVELNVDSALAVVIVTDNHDQDLTVVASINGTPIDYSNYKFLTIGEHAITYTVKDSSNNEEVVTQIILVKDTTPPVLKTGTITTYNAGVSTVLEFNMPVFVDSDGSDTEYVPYEIKMLDTLGNEMDSTLSTYPLSYYADTVRVRFATGYSLGNYTIVFAAKDAQNNVVVEEFTITLSDLTPPEINIFINGNETTNGSVNIFPFNSSVNVEARAEDTYEGDLTGNITKKITFNGSPVNSIDTSKSGDYLVQFTVVDAYSNTTTVETTIRIADDKVLPVIDTVMVNGKEFDVAAVNKLNGTTLVVNVEASDDSNQVATTILYSDEHTSFIVNEGNQVSLESGLINYTFDIIVEVEDSSGNRVTRTYKFIIDNVTPNITGVNQDKIYSSNLSVEVYDDNIESIEVFKNGQKIASFTSSLYNYTISEDGVYSIVAKDSYGNVKEVNFVVIKDKKYTMIDENNNTITKEFDEALLLETRVSDSGINLVLNSSVELNKNDQVYVLINYPGTEHKYLIYSMNGQTYNSNSSIDIEGQVIEGVDNTSLLEKIGDKYYAYAMVMKAEVDNNIEQPDEGRSVVGEIIMVILGILLSVCIVIIIIKIRRRVRAV